MRNLTMLTDLYQLTMAYGYWKNQMDRREAVFHLSFRKNPFDSGFAVAAGLVDAIEYLRKLHFGEEDLAYLRSLKGRDGKELFEPDFLHYLGRLTFECD